MLGPGETWQMLSGDSSLQSSRAGWLITQMGLGSAADEGAHGAGRYSVLPPPTPWGLAPASSVWEGRARRGVHMGNFAKTPAVLEDVLLSQAAEASGAGVVEMEAGVRPQCFFFFPAPPSLLAVGERGACKPCNPGNRSRSCSACWGWEDIQEPPQAKQGLSALELQTFQKAK